MDAIQLAEQGTEGGLMQNLQLLIPLAIILILGIWMRRRRGARSNLEIAVGLVSDVRYNLKVINVFSSTTPSYKKLKTGTWQKNSAKIEFLDEQLRNSIVTAFTAAVDYNNRVSESKQRKSSAYMLGVDTGKMVDAFGKSQEGLSSWIKENWQVEMRQRRRPGLFG